MSRIVCLGNKGINGLIFLACDWIPLRPNFFMMQVEMLNRIHGEEEHSHRQKSNSFKYFLRAMDELMCSIGGRGYENSEAVDRYKPLKICLMMIWEINT